MSNPRPGKYSELATGVLVMLGINSWREIALAIVISVLAVSIGMGTAFITIGGVVEIFGYPLASFPFECGSTIQWGTAGDGVSINYCKFTIKQAGT